MGEYCDHCGKAECRGECLADETAATVAHTDEPLKWIWQWLKGHFGFWGILIFTTLPLLLGWLWTWKVTLMLAIGFIVVIVLEMSYDFALEWERERRRRKRVERLRQDFNDR